MAIKKIQREEIEQSPSEKLVIYKSMGDFKITPESNFRASIQNAKAIIDLKDFDTVDEIIDYYKKWFHSKDDDFIIDDSAKENLEESLKLITSYTNFDEKEKALAKWIYKMCPPNANRELNAMWADAVPSYDEVIKEFDSEIRRDQYEKVRDVLIDTIKDVNYYDMYLELSDRPVAKEMGSLKLSTEAWEDIKDKYLKKFEEITGVQAWSYGANGKHVVVENDLTNLFGYSQMKDVLKKLQDEMIEEVNDYDRTFDPTKELKNNVIEVGDKVLHVFYDKKNNKLCAGGATNVGIIPEYEIDYDVDASLDANLNNLMDKIQENVEAEDADFEESLKCGKKLAENAPNFKSLKYLPLLVFYDGTTIGNDFDDHGVAVLDTLSMKNLKDEINSFNQHCKGIKNYNPSTDVEVKVSLEPGNAEGVQVYCANESSLTEDQFEEVYDFFEYLHREYGLTWLSNNRVFNNRPNEYFAADIFAKQEGFEQDVAEEWGKKAYLLNSIISSLNDEDAYYGEWLYVWPDGTKEENAKYYFETEADYNDLFKTFEKVYKKYHDSGLITADENVISLAHDFDKKFGLKPIEIL